MSTAIPTPTKKKKKNFVLYQFNVPRNTDLIISTPHLRDQVSHEVQGRSAAFMTKQDPAQGKELYGIWLFYKQRAYSDG